MTAGTPETTLTEHLEEYLVRRRALGYRLDKLELLAGQFCDWLAAHGKTTFTSADAVTWARLPADADPSWWGMRLGAVRTFAAYLHATGVDVQVPPSGILPARAGRAAPFIYSQADIDALLAACPRVFHHRLVAETMGTLIGLLAATGIRIGEALRLTPGDIDLESGVLLIRASKGTDGWSRSTRPASTGCWPTATCRPAGAPAPTPPGRCSCRLGAPVVTARPSRVTTPGWRPRPG